MCNADSLQSLSVILKLGKVRLYPAYLSTRPEASCCAQSMPYFTQKEGGQRGGGGKKKAVPLAQWLGHSVRNIFNQL